jgi:hypothetical protein
VRNVWNRAPARIGRVVQKALSINPADRYPTMSEMLRALSRVTLRDVVFGMDYTFRQRAMPLMAILTMTGQLAFYFLDGRLLGMHDSLPVRCLAAGGDELEEHPERGGGSKTHLTVALNARKAHARRRSRGRRRP